MPPWARPVFPAPRADFVVTITDAPAPAALTAADMPAPPDPTTSTSARASERLDTAPILADRVSPRDKGSLWGRCRSGHVAELRAGEVDEGLGDPLGGPPGVPDGEEAALQPGPFEGEGDEAAVGELPLHREPRDDRDAEAVEHRRLHRLLQAELHLHLQVAI